MTRFATYVGRGLYREVEGVRMTRGVPVEVPSGKLTVLRQHPDVVVADGPEPPELPEPTDTPDQEA
jgi:hypothetical protein